MSMFGDMFDDEDCSLSTFTPGRGNQQSGGAARPYFFDRRSQTGFVGLLNQGTTCYLNSLIQALYMTPELREGLYSLSPDDLQVVVPITEEERRREKESTEKPADKESSSNADSAPLGEKQSGAASETNKEREEGKNFLLGMGFEEALVEKALDRYPNPSERNSAVDWLLSGAPGSETSSTNKKRGREELEEERDDVLPFGGGRAEAFDASEYDIFSGAAEAFSSAAGEEEERDSHRKPVSDAPPSNPPPSPETPLRENGKRDAPVLVPEAEDEEESDGSAGKGGWECGACTYLNTPDTTSCEICMTAKPVVYPKRAKRAKTETPTENATTKETPTVEGGAKENHVDEAKGEKTEESGGEAAPPSKAEPAAPPPTHRIVKREIPIELQRLFSLLQAADQEAVSTEQLTDSFGWKGTSQVFDQHDVHELNRVLFDAIDRSLHSTPKQTLLSDLYKGTLVNQIICCACKKISENEEPFQDVTLPVVGLSSVQESLASCTSYERLKGDNQYFCERCNKKVDALKGSSFRSLPPILTLLLARFTFDIETESRVKKTGHFAYPLVLDLHRYTEEVSVQEKLNSIQEETAEEQPAPSETKKDTDNNNNKSEQADKGKNGKKAEQKELTDEEEAEAKRRKEAKKQATRERKLQALIDLSAVDPKSPDLYYLFAVVIHCGKDAGWGHYHAYIRDVFHRQRMKAKQARGGGGEQGGEGAKQEGENKSEDGVDAKEEKTEDIQLTFEELKQGWYDFNDSFTKSLPIDTLTSQYSGKGECGYMLVYRRKDLDDECQLKGEPQVPPHLHVDMRNHNRLLDQERERYIEKQNDVDVLVFSTLHLKILGGVLRKNEDLDEANKKRARQLITLKKDLPMSVLLEHIAQAFGKDVPAKETLKLDQIQFQGNRVHFSKAIPIDEEHLTKTLEEMHIGTHSILAWDGSDVNGERWDGESDQITITVTCYASPQLPSGLPASPSADLLPNVSDFTIRISEKALLQELKAKLEELTGIPADTQHIYKPQYKELILLQENRISLFDLGIYNLSRVTVELNRPEESRSWSWLMFLRKQNMVEIFVTDKITGYTPHPTLSVELEKSATILDLKIAIASKLPEGLINVNHVIVRKSLVGGGGGVICTDDALPLTHAGISDGMRVIAEASEEASGVSMITIRFICGFAHSLIHKGMDQIFEIAVPRSHTIKQCKEAMLELFNKTGTYRLSTTNVWEKPEKLFDDEELTLEQAKVMDNDVLWLEEGKPPVKGQIAIDFQLYFLQDPEFYEPIPEDSEGYGTETKEFNSANFWRVPIPSLDDDFLNEEDKLLLMETVTDEAKEKLTPNLPSASTESPKTKQAFYDLVMSPAIDLSAKTFNSKARQDIYVVSPLWRLEVPSSLTLMELKMQLIQKQTLNHVPSPRHVRLWQDDRLLKHNSLSLKKQHVGNESVLTIQILDAPDDESSDGHILFYIHKRNVKAKAFEPPLQYWFTGNTCQDLRNEIASLMGIPEADLLLTKYLHYNGKWRVVTDMFGMDGKDSEAQIRAQAKSKAKAQGLETTAGKGEELQQTSEVSKKKSIQMKPFFMKDGDVLVAKDMREDLDNKDDFVTQANYQNKGGGRSRRHVTRGPRPKGKPVHIKEKPLYIHVADFEGLKKHNVETNAESTQEGKSQSVPVESPKENC